MKLFILLSLLAFSNCQETTVAPPPPTTILTTLLQDTVAGETAGQPVVKPGVAYETPVTPIAGADAKAQSNGNTNDEYPDRIDISRNPAFGNALGNVDKLNPGLKPEIILPLPVGPSEKPTENKKPNQPTDKVNPSLPVDPSSIPVPQNFNPTYHIPANFYPHLNQIPHANLVPLNPYGYNGYNTRPVFSGYHPGYGFHPIQHFHTGYVPHHGYHQFHPSPIFTGIPNNFINPYPALQPHQPQPHQPQPHQPQPHQPLPPSTTEPKVSDQNTATKVESKIKPVITEDVTPLPSLTISITPSTPEPNVEEKIDINPQPAADAKENNKETLPAAGKPADQTAASSNTFAVGDVDSQVRSGYNRALRDFRRNTYFNF